MERHLELEKIIEPVVSGLGYSFVGLQQFPQGRHSLIRVYIDKPEGVAVDDCERASRQIAAVLDVDAPSVASYMLEVSSPGVDRLLFTEQQFKAELGKKLTLRLKTPVEGRKNYQGILKNVESEGVVVEVLEATITLSFADILEARLLPEW